jgi:hemerythrin
MASIIWTNEYSVNVSEFDKQHQMLFSYINNLVEAMQNRQSDQILSNLIDDLFNYTQTHFSTEEKLLEQHNFPKLAEHKEKHKEFILEVEKFKTELNNKKLGISIEIASFLKKWITNHIQVVDKEYAAFLNEKGVK